MLWEACFIQKIHLISNASRNLPSLILSNFQFLLNMHLVLLIEIIILIRYSYLADSNFEIKYCIGQQNIHLHRYIIEH